MNYKPSQFNILKEESNELKIINLFSKKAALISDKYLFKQILLENSKYEDTILFSKMVDLGFLVDQQLDETQLIEYLYYCKAYQTSRLKLIIVPTQNCNFKCQYCYQIHETKRMSESVQDSIICYIKKNLHKYKSLEIHWFGGEPLLELDLIEKIMIQIKKIAKEYHCPVISTMTTNGYLLDFNTFLRLFRLGIYFYQITIDGPAEIQNKQRPHPNGDSFQKILLNLKEIHKRCNSSILKISLRTNFTEDSISTADDLLSEYKDKLELDPRFLLDFNMADDWGGKKDVHYLNYKKYLSLINCIYAKAKSCGFKFTENGLFEPGGGICAAQENCSYIIDYDGSIHKCTIAMFVEEYRNISKIGQLTSDGSMEIDLKKQFLWLFNSKDRSNCRSCHLLSYCMARPCIYAVNVKHINQCVLDSRSNPISKLFYLVDKYEIL